MADNKRDVEFIIRARDLGSRTFKEVATAVAGITSNLDKQLEAADRAEISANELRTSYRNLEQAGKALIKQQGIIDFHRKVADNLELAEAKAKDARAAEAAYADQIAKSEKVMKVQERTLVKMTKAAEGAEKRAESLRTTLAAQSERLEQAGIDTGNLALSQQKLVATANQVGDALSKTQGALDNYDANLRKAKASQDALSDAKTLADFRRIGDVATTNANSVAKSADVIDTSASNISSRLRAIVAPSKAAGETLGGLGDEITRLDAVVGAADKPLRDYQDAIYDLGQAQRAILQQAGSIDAFRNQEVAVERAERAMESAKAEVLQYAAAVSTADEPNRELVSSLRQAEATLAAENRELDLQQRKLNQLSANLKKAGIDVKDLAGAERQLEAASGTSAAALGRLDAAAAGKNSKAGRFLGLRPYELTNLSYQINDVFTQIASGTSVTQTLAQQGGQIVQIFPRAFAAMAAFIPELLAISAVLAAIGAAFKNAGDESKSLRQFEGLLTLSADGASYSAKNLAALTHQIDVLGPSVEEARKIVTTFLDAGLDESKLRRFSASAIDLADVTGKSVPDAAKMLADGFSRGYEAVIKLNDELNFLTASEQLQIKAMFDSGDAAGARTRAFEIFERQADKAADKARGSWGDAFKALTRIWDNLVESIGNSKPIQEAIGILDQLADAAERASGNLPQNLAAAGGGVTSGLVQRAPQYGGFQGSSLITGNGPYAAQNRAVASILDLPGFTPQPWMGGAATNNTQGAVQITPEIRAIVATAMKEALAGNAAGQADVAAVILNRMQRSGQTAQSVVTAPYQFEGVGNAGSQARKDWEAINQNTAGFADTLKNILPILEGRIADPTKGATMFFSPQGQAANGRGVPSWANPADMTVARAGHQFYNGAFPGDRRIGVGGGDTVNPDSARGTIAGAEELRQLKEEIALRDKSNNQLRLEVAMREARERIINAGGSDAQANEAAEATRVDLQRKIDEENAKKAEVEARRTEAEKRRLESMTDTLRTDLRGLETRAQRVQDSSLASRLQAIDTQFSGIEQNLKEAEAAGAKAPDGLTFTTFRERIEANKTILKQQETMAYYEDQINSLEEQRAARLKQIADDAATGAITSAQAYLQASDVTSELAPRIAAMADDAVKFAQGIATATPNPQLQAFIAGMSRTSAREGRNGATNTPQAGVGREQVNARESELNAIIQQRNELIANYGRLVDLGVMTQSEAQRKTADAYRSTQPLIETQVAAFKELIAAMHDSGSMTDAVFANWQTRLEVISQESVYVDANFTKIKGTLTDGIANAATQAFDTVSQGIGNALAGTASWSDALDSLWSAALQGAASLLQSLGEVLLQIAVMQAIKSLPFLDGVTNGIMSATGLVTGATALGTAAAATTAAGAAVTAGGATLTAGATAATAAGAALTTGGATLVAASGPLMAAAAAMTAAAVAMQVAASLQMAANATGGGILHSGGLVGMGSSSVSRKVSPLAWVGAPRHHTGTVVGLKTDERASILQVGEEVLAKNDPRNIMNGGAGASPQGGRAPTPLKQVLVLDPREITGAMQSSAGEDVTMTHIKVNIGTVRTLLGL